MFKSTFYAATGICLMIFAASSASAEDTFPFTGAVQGDKVNIRAGAGTTYYPVVQANDGTLVRVHKNIFGWYQITPPEGSFCYVEKASVQLDPDGKTGKVTDGRAAVKAPSPSGPEKSYRRLLVLEGGTSVTILGEEADSYKITPPPGTYFYIKSDLIRRATDAEIAAAAPKKPEPPKPTTPEKQPEAPVIPPTPTPVPTPVPTPAPAPTTVVPTPEPSTPVTIKQTDAPPPAKGGSQSSTIYLDLDTTGSIRLGGRSFGPDQLAAPMDQIAKTNKPDVAVSIRAPEDVAFSKIAAVIEAASKAGLTNVDVAGKNTTPPADNTTVAANTPDTTPRPQDAELIELEAKYDALIEKEDVTDAELEALAKAYHDRLNQADPALTESEQILGKAHHRLLETRRQVLALRQDLDAFKREVAKDRKHREALAAARPKNYAAQGRLQGSSIYTGDQLPLLYRVVDPETELTIAYVAPAPGVDMNALIGQPVGIVGDSKFDPALKLKYIQPKAVDHLTLKPQPAG